MLQWVASAGEIEFRQSQLGSVKGSFDYCLVLGELEREDSVSVKQKW